MIKQNHGFTLIELSISFVIIALILAGIAFGFSLVKQHKVQSVVSEVANYQLALQSFQFTFQAIPGDMINATAYWSNYSSCTGTTGVAGYCNGNNNNSIDSTTTATNTNEEIRAWQHLGFAGLINGQYPGIASTSSVSEVNQVPGTTNPSSKYTPGGYFLTNTAGLTSTYVPTNVFSAKNVLGLGSYIGNGLPISNLLLPNDAYNIDLKIDDGLPATGNVIGASGSGASYTCYSNGTNVYSFSTSTAACVMIFNIF